MPLAEVNATAPGAPTASQPAGPCVTLPSAVRPGLAETSESGEIRVQEPPPALRQIAG